MFMGDNGIHVNVAPYKKTKEAKPEAKAEPKKPKAKKPKKTSTLLSKVTLSCGFACQPKYRKTSKNLNREKQTRYVMEF